MKEAETARIHAANALLAQQLLSVRSSTDNLLDTEAAALRRKALAVQSDARRANEAAEASIRNHAMRQRLDAVRAVTDTNIRGAVVATVPLHEVEAEHWAHGDASAAQSESMHHSQRPVRGLRPRRGDEHDSQKNSGGPALDADISETQERMGDEDAWLKANPDAVRRLQSYRKMRTR